MSRSLHPLVRILKLEYVYLEALRLRHWSSFHYREDSQWPPPTEVKILKSQWTENSMYYIKSYIWQKTFLPSIYLFYNPFMWNFWIAKIICSDRNQISGYLFVGVEVGGITIKRQRGNFGGMIEIGHVLIGIIVKWELTFFYTY